MRRFEKGLLFLAFWEIFVLKLSQGPGRRGSRSLFHENIQLVLPRNFTIETKAKRFRDPV